MLKKLEEQKNQSHVCFIIVFPSVRAVYDELHNTLMAIDEQDDLRWWKNTHGPGMPTDWPHFQVYPALPAHTRSLLSV